MSQISLSIPQIGQPDTTEDPKIQNALTTIQNVINGNLDGTNLSAVAAQSAGVNQSGQAVKGAAIIATSQSTSSTTFTTLSTPDQVTGIVLPSPGLIAVWYQATWQESVTNASKAGIFLGSNQVQIANTTGTSGAQANNGGATPNINTPLSTCQFGLSSTAASGGYTGDVATGQIIGGSGVTNWGGPCYIFATAGTYTISIQFKASSGSVTVSNRRLYVQATSFA